MRLHLKAELFQKTGSFKPRGVFNKLLSMRPTDLSRGLVSMSAGNHAAALAYGATAVGARATIVMPATALPSKVEATKRYGGEVVQTEGVCSTPVWPCSENGSHAGPSLRRPRDHGRPGDGGPLGSSSRCQTRTWLWFRSEVAGSSLVSPWP